jgi:hypothetical protein
VWDCSVEELNQPSCDLDVATVFSSDSWTQTYWLCLVETGIVDFCFAKFVPCDWICNKCVMIERWQQWKITALNCPTWRFIVYCGWLLNWMIYLNIYVTNPLLIEPRS